MSWIHLLGHLAAGIAPAAGHHGGAAGSGGATGGKVPKIPLDSFLAWFLQVLIFMANFAGGLVVGVATVRGLFIYVTDLVRARGSEVPKEAIRLSLGRSLALALEFQVGADILGTALNPSSSDIAILGAIVVLRTVLNFFLQRELREASRRDGPTTVGTSDEGNTVVEPGSLA